MLDAFFQEGLRRNPEGATQLGLDTGANADLKHQAVRRSVRGRRQPPAPKALNLDQLAPAEDHRSPPRSRPTGKRSATTPIAYTRARLRVRRPRAAHYDFGGSKFGPSPYVVSQLTGSYQNVPDFLDTKHRIETAEDAEAYLDRLSAFAVQAGPEHRALKQHDAGLGVAPPDFILDTALTQLMASPANRPPTSRCWSPSIAKRAMPPRSLDAPLRQGRRRRI